VRRRPESSPGVAWWTLVSAGAAPVLLAGGWTIAARRQPAGYSSVRDTISSLAARGATDRWIMTAALAGVGVAYAVSAAGLAPVRRVGRVALALGGVGTVLVAAFPQPAAGNSVAHTVAAALGFIALGAWPVLATDRASRNVLLHRGASVVATVASFGLLLWFVLEIHGSHRGLAERSAALVEALWPLAVVVVARRNYGLGARSLNWAPAGSATVASRP
jgi:hypothetical membrane protein